MKEGGVTDPRSASTAMDDIDDLFTDTINDDLNIDLNGALAGDLNDELNVQLDDHLANTLNGQLDIPTILAPPAGLIERLDELHTGGCNQSVPAKSSNDDSRYIEVSHGRDSVLWHLLVLIERL